MASQELVLFIKKSLAQGNSRSDIEEALAKKGWTRAQVSDGFSAVSAPGKAAEKSTVSFLKSKTFLWVLFAVALIALVIVGVFIFFPVAEEEVECTRDRDCDSGFECDEGSCVEEEIIIAVAECEDDPDCDEGFACDAGSCVEEVADIAECLVDEDCLFGFECENDVCVEEDTGGPSITIVECETTSDCNAGYSCVDTSCEPEYNLTVTCIESDSDYNLTLVGSAYGIWYSNGSLVNFTDTCDQQNNSQIFEYWCPGTGEDYEGYVYTAIVACPSGFSCSDGACANVTAACTSDADCGTGYVCTSGVCEVEPECVTDDDCADGETCSADGSCEAEVVILTCDSDDDCAPYACDTTSGTCETSCDYAGDWSECAAQADGYGCALDDTCVGGYDIAVVCSEDDINSGGNGNIVTVAGTTIGTSYYDGADASWTDFCTADGQLVEYWCPGTGEAFEGYAYGKIVDCDADSVCTNGACVERVVVLSIVDVTFEGSPSDFSTLIFNVAIENTGNIEGDAAVSCTLDLSDAFIGTPTVTASLEASASATIGAEESATLSCIFDIMDVKNDLIAAGTSTLFGPMTATLGESTKTITVVLAQEDLFGECLVDADCTEEGEICDFDSSNMVGVCVETECNDGLDNDDNGDIDLGDTGCDSIDDTNEYTPACKDGKDNDGDGKIDYSGAMELTATASEGEAFEGIFSCDWDYAALVDEYFTSEKRIEINTAITDYADGAGMSLSEKVAFLALEIKRIRAFYTPTISTCKEVCGNISEGQVMNSDFNIDTFTLDCDFVDADNTCSSPTSTSEYFYTPAIPSFPAPEKLTLWQKIWDFIAKAPPALYRLLGQ